MQAVCLITNDSNNPRLFSEHGLSIYLKIDNGQQLLLDIGQTNLVLDNAVKLGIDLSKIDYLIISHGHYDHIGGLANFLQINSTAKIIVGSGINKPKIRQKPDGTYKALNIGLSDILGSIGDRLIVNMHDVKIGNHITICSDLSIPQPQTNFKIQDSQGTLQNDYFEDEQALMINSADKTALFSGCAHNGVVHTVKTIQERYLIKQIDLLYGGLHLNDCSIEELSSIEQQLKELRVKQIYSGHCSSKMSKLPVNRNIKNIYSGQHITFFS